MRSESLQSVLAQGSREAAPPHLRWWPKDAAAPRSGTQEIGRCPYPPLPEIARQPAAGSRQARRRRAWSCRSWRKRRRGSIGGVAPGSAARSGEDARPGEAEARGTVISWRELSRSYAVLSQNRDGRARCSAV